MPLLSIVKVCGEITRSDANEPVESEEPLKTVPEPLNTLCATNPPLILAFSNVVVLVLNDELDSVIEPLPSNNATLVENEPLLGVNELPLASFLVTLV